MHGEMLTHAAAAPDFGWATHSAPSFNTAAYCFTERHRSAAANSASSPHTTTDAYRFAASYASTTPLGTEETQLCQLSPSLRNENEKQN